MSLASAVKNGIAKAKSAAARVNKAIGALLGGGVLAALTATGVISDEIGTNVQKYLIAAAALLGAFLAPKNKGA